jgi:hypothetical protein
MKRNRLMMSKYRLSEAKMYSSGSKEYLKNKRISMNVYVKFGNWPKNKEDFT